MDYHRMYTFADGDLVLQSSDNYKFRVHSIFLMTASTVFADMINMPQPIPMNVGNGTDATDEIVPLSEPSLVLLFVLASIYPHVEIPSITSFADAHAVADAADKYEMFRVREVLRIAVLANESLRKVPLRLFHLARKCKWGDVVASASEMTLDWNLMTGPFPNNAAALNEHAIQIGELSGNGELFGLTRLHLARKHALLNELSLDRSTDFLAHFEEGVVLLWLCPACNLEGSIENDTAEEGLQILRDVVAAYLERVPKGSALFDLVPPGYTPKLLPESGSVDAIHKNFACSECASPFFSAARIIHHFRGIEATLPRSVLLDLAVG